MEGLIKKITEDPFYLELGLQNLFDADKNIIDNELRKNIKIKELYEEEV